MGRPGELVKPGLGTLQAWEKEREILHVLVYQVENDRKVVQYPLEA